MLRITFPNNYSVECFLEYKIGVYCVTSGRQKDKRVLKFFFRNPKNNVLIEFQHDEEISGSNEVFQIGAMVALDRNLFAVVISRRTNNNPHNMHFVNDLLIFNAKEGVLVSTTLLSVGVGDNIAGMIYANGLIYVGVRTCIHIYNIREENQKNPVRESVNTMRGFADIIAMRLTENNRLTIATQKSIQSYNLSGDLTNLKNKEIEFVVLKPIIRHYFNRIGLLPQGTLIGVYHMNKRSVISIKNFQSDKVVEIPILENKAILGSTILPTGNMAVLFQENYPPCLSHIYIYNPMNGEVVQQFQDVKVSFDNEGGLIYYIEYLEWASRWMDSIKDIIASAMTSSVPKALIDIIISYVSCFSLSDPQMLDWFSTSTTAQWDNQHSCVIFKTDKKRDWSICTKQGVQNARLVFKEEKIEDKKNEESKQLDAFKKIYQALYDGETTIWKEKNFLTGKENYSDTELKNAIHMKQRQNSGGRTSRAWHLAFIHYNNLEEDEYLFTQIYKQSFSNSGWFKRSRITQENTFFKSCTFNSHVHLVTKEKIDPHKEDNTRGGKIYRALAGR